jgi:uncharacterized protein involved in exopolysaccharide biosynthesis
MKESARETLQNFGKSAMTGGLLTVAVALLYIFATPKSYQAGTKLKLVRGDWMATNHVGSPYDPAIVPAEVQFLRSDELLLETVTNLHLAEAWGKRYKGGGILTTNESLGLLRSKSMVRALPKSTVIQILVTSEEPEETAAIANEMTRLYRESRRLGRKSASEEKIAALKKEWEEQSQQLTDALENFERVQFEISMSRTTNPITVYDREGLLHLQNQRIQLEAEYVQEQSLLDNLKSLGPDQLRQVVATTSTNEFLHELLDKLATARTELKLSTANAGTNAPESRQAAAAVGELNKQVDAFMQATLGLKSAELASTKAALDKATDMLKHAQARAVDTNSESQEFTAAYKKVETLRAQNEELKNQLDAASMDALIPSAVAIDVLSTAETPTQPATPNRPAAMKVVYAGAALLLMGVLLRLMTHQRPGSPVKLN